MKKSLKLLLIVFVYSTLFIISNAVLPFSAAFKEANAQANPLSAIFLLISSFFNCSAICFIASGSNWRGAKRAIGIIFVVFMISAFMTQIETLFFGAHFQLLTQTDILFIMLATLPSIVSATILGIHFLLSQAVGNERAGSNFNVFLNVIVRDYNGIRSLFTV